MGPVTFLPQHWNTIMKILFLTVVCTANLLQGKVLHQQINSKVLEKEDKDLDINYYGPLLPDEKIKLDVEANTKMKPLTEDSEAEAPVRRQARLFDTFLDILGSDLSQRHHHSTYSHSTSPLLGIIGDGLYHQYQREKHWQQHRPYIGHTSHSHHTTHRHTSHHNQREDSCYQQLCEGSSCQCCNCITCWTC